MVNDNKYFYIGGLISLSLFAFFLTLFLFLLFQKNITKTYGLKKENYVSISMEMVHVKPKQVKKQTQVSKPVENTVQESKNIDVNDLFSDVWTQKIEHKKEQPKEVNSKRIQEIAKRIKTSEKKDMFSLEQQLVTQDNVNNDKEYSNSSSADEVNEYLAKIQAIIYDNFNPPANSEGNVVTIVIELGPLGKLIDFRVLNYSSNEALNAEADRIKQRLFRIIFPKNPNSTTYRAVINLIPENKE